MKVLEWVERATITNWTFEVESQNKLQVQCCGAALDWLWGGHPRN